MVARFYQAYLADSDFSVQVHDSSPESVARLCDTPADVVICPAFPQFQEGPVIASTIKADPRFRDTTLIVSTSVEGHALSGAWDLDLVDGLLIMPFEREDLIQVLEQAKRRSLSSARHVPLAVVVDDSATARFVLQKEMEGLNFEVRTAVDGQEGLALIQEIMPDLVLTDIEMPRMNGLELCNALANDPKTSQIPIVVISSIINDAKVRGGFGSGVINFLKKPINPAELASAVASLVGADHLTRRGTALLVEDDLTAAAVIRKELTRIGVHSNHCRTVAELETYLAVSRPDLIVLDMVLPDGRGPDVCQSLRGRPDLAGATIIILAEDQDRDAMIQCLQHHADDYLIKPFTQEEIRVRVETHLRNKKLHEELTQRNRILESLAYQDSLTGLMNRRYLDEGLPREIDLARRNGTSLGFLLMDLDHFKRVNDTYGHQVGDDILRLVAAEIQGRTRDVGVACRYGGEEMCVMLPGASLVKAREIAERIRTACEKQTFTELRIRQTISIGVSAFPEPSGAYSLIRDADQAVYRAKKNGRNQVAST
jgi:two-component system cell cycle response regulator